MVIGAIVALAFGALAQAHGHMGLHPLGQHRNLAGVGAVHPPTLGLGRDRNIRSGDHFVWRQGDRRS